VTPSGDEARVDVGTWPWIMQRLSGLFLLIFLGIHLWVLHYVEHGVEITIASVQIRLRNVLFVVVDYLMLTFAVYHGLNGVRNVLYDLWFGERTRKMITVVLTLLGIALTIMGLIILLPFLQEGST